MDRILLSENLLKIEEALQRRSGLKVTGDKVRIVGVTKNHPAELLADCWQIGLTHIGENRVQEAKHKLAELEGKVLCRLNCHLIGHLQTNKARDAVKIFDLIESVDSWRLLEVLNGEAGKIQKCQDILLQVNIAEEPQKYGFLVPDYKEVVFNLGGFPNLRLQGLMVIAPAVNNPEEVRPVFRKGYELYENLQALFPVKILSMGMSNDFVVAVEEGANQIRLGRALFGERNYSFRF